ncbi:MAG: hypothetical protein ACRDHS_10120, partial [Actinomycetota bacterium]
IKLGSAIGIMGPMGSGGGGGGATGCSDVLAAGFLRAAAFRVVAFLAAGFLRAAAFFRTVAFLAAVFFRPAGLRTATVFFRAVFLRVALLVRATALVLLAGIAITFPIVGDNRIHTIGVRCPERGERIRTSLFGYHGLAHR